MNRYLLLAAVLLAGCAGGPPLKPFPQTLPANLPQEIAGVPFHPQEALQCGPAALATVLGWSGVEASPATLSRQLFIPARGGTLQPELKAQARVHGRLAYELPPEPAALLAELAAGHPVLVLQNNGITIWPYWHYAVVVGADEERVYLRSGRHRLHELKAKTFLRTWRRAGYWALAVLPPDRLPVSVIPDEALRAFADFMRVHPDAPLPALELAVARWPEHGGLRFARANRLYAEGDTARAAEEYRAILARQPDALPVRNNLAWLLAEQGAAAEALQLLETDAGAERWREELAHTRSFARCRQDGHAVTECERRAAAR